MTRWSNLAAAGAVIMFATGCSSAHDRIGDSADPATPAAIGTDGEPAARAVGGSYVEEEP